MPFRLRVAGRVLAHLMPTLILGACLSGDMTTAHAPSFDFGGIYPVSDSRVAVSCSPVPLPPAEDSVNTQYAQLVGVPIGTSLAVDQQGTTISITQVGNSGGAFSGQALVGSIDVDAGSASMSSNWTSRVEGPRAGGHTFFVADTVFAVMHFEKLIGFPTVPGGSAEVVGIASLGSLSERFVFRDGGGTGSVFTTCVVTDSITAGRTGN